MFRGDERWISVNVRVLREAREREREMEVEIVACAESNNVNRSGGGVPTHDSRVQIVRKTR